MPDGAVLGNQQGEEDAEEPGDTGADDKTEPFFGGIQPLLAQRLSAPAGR